MSVIMDRIAYENFLKREIRTLEESIPNATHDEALCTKYKLQEARKCMQMFNTFLGITDGERRAVKDLFGIDTENKSIGKED